MKDFCRIASIVALGASLVIAGCAAREPLRAAGSTLPAATLERELLEADRAFAVAAGERGIDGWMSYFADDAARIGPPGPAIRGTEAIRAFDLQIFGDPTLRLLWEPTEAGAFATGDHGFTRGRYRLVRDDGSTDEPVTLSSGSYLSIWRRDDGRWKVILDTGTPDP